MDKAERSRLRCLLIAESQHRVGSRIALYRGAAKALPSLIDALDAAEAERDAARVEAARLKEAIRQAIAGIEVRQAGVVDILPMLDAALATTTRKEQWSPD